MVEHYRLIRKKKTQRIDGRRESASLGEFVKIGRKKKLTFFIGATGKAENMRVFLSARS